MNLLKLFSKDTKNAISSEDLQVLIKKKPAPVIVDVRSRAEFDEEKIPNAVNLDIHHPKFDKIVSKWAKKSTYVVYCQSGPRSRRALKKMSKLGIQNIYYLEGGIFNYEGRIV